MGEGMAYDGMPFPDTFPDTFPSPLFMSYTSHLANVFSWKYDYK